MGLSSLIFVAAQPIKQANWLSLLQVLRIETARLLSMPFGCVEECSKEPEGYSANGYIIILQNT